MSEFFDIPTAASLSADIGSYTGEFFLPFLGPVLFLAGLYIAIGIVKKMRSSFTSFIKSRRYR